MRTTLTIDDKLAHELMRNTGQKSLIEATMMVIRDYLDKRKKNKLLGLFGKMDLDVDVDELRNREVQEHDRG